MTTTTVTAGGTTYEVPVRPPFNIRAHRSHPVWMTHTHYEAKYDNQRRYDEETEATRRMQHLQRHGTLDGFVAARRFPCTGVLRFHDQGQHHWIAQCDECGFSVGVRRDKIDREHMVLERVRRAGLPTEFAGRALDADVPGQAAARRALAAYWTEYDAAHPPKGVMLTGAPGTGKSHLLVAAADTLIRRHLADVKYLTLSDLLMAERATFGTGQVRTPLVRAQEAQVLVLDDMGAERDTDYAHETLRQLVDVRYRERRGILAATNLPVAQWPAAFGERTTSRLLGMLDPIPVEGQDRRQL